MAKPRVRKRLLTRLNEALDEVEALIKDSDKKPSALKAAVSRAEILHDLLKRDDAEKLRKAVSVATASAPAVVAPAAPASAADLIAQVEVLTQRNRGENGNIEA